MALSEKDYKDLKTWLYERRREVEMKAGYGNWYQTEGALEMIRACLDKLEEVGHGSD